MIVRMLNLCGRLIEKYLGANIGYKQILGLDSLFKEDAIVIVSHHSLLTHTKYTKHIFHTGPGHETHKTHKSFCSENIWNTYTQQKKFSPNT